MVDKVVIFYDFVNYFCIIMELTFYKIRLNKRLRGCGNEKDKGGEEIIISINHALFYLFFQPQKQS